MITAESKTDNVIAAKKAGVNNYIVKPFNAQTLRAQDPGGVPDRPGRRRPPDRHHASRRITAFG